MCLGRSSDPKYRYDKLKENILAIGKRTIGSPHSLENRIWTVLQKNLYDLMENDKFPIYMSIDPLFKVDLHSKDTVIITTRTKHCHVLMSVKLKPGEDFNVAMNNLEHLLEKYGLHAAPVTDLSKIARVSNSTYSIDLKEHYDISR